MNRLLFNSGRNTKGAVGFCLTSVLSTDTQQRAVRACNQALGHFPWLIRMKLNQGSAQLEVWSHHEGEESVYFDQRGNLFALIGSPMNSIAWEEAIKLLEKKGDENFELPWEGRCILIKIFPDGQNWTMWNDWCGSIPVFHAETKEGSIVSSLEPVVVSAFGFTEEDFSKRGLVEMLLHGHFLGTDTLFEKMNVLPADSFSSWKNGKFNGSKKLWTVRPSDALWDISEDKLIPQMYELTVQIIREAAKYKNQWILPLSGGMDSRLMACLGKEQGVDIRAFTYGPENWNEVVYARQIARELNIPWERIDLGTNYLADYTLMWLQWFGTSLHAHGMYQLPFLAHVKNLTGVIPDGWYGNNCAGGNHPSKVLLDNHKSVWLGFYKGYNSMWSIEELRQLLNFDVDPVIEEITSLIDSQITRVKDWPHYHQRNAVDMWNRQQRFVFYQPMMYDYWKGSLTPFMNRAYARFCFSLPIGALDIRYLQRLMLKQYWPKLADIGGTYEEVSFSNKHYAYIKQLFTRFFPWEILAGLSQLLGKVPNTMELDCLRKDGLKALFPLSQEFSQQEIFNGKVVRATIQRALSYSQKDYSKLSALQPIFHFLLNQGSRASQKRYSESMVQVL